MITADYDLQHLNTLGCPSRAEYFCAVSTLAELTEALAWAQQRSLRVNLLGGGSNVLCAPVIPGLTLAPNLLGRNAVKQAGEQIWVELAAGENWHQAVLWCSSQGWYGLENLALIPGSAGAAPIQNIGAYGVELAQLLSEVICFNRETQSLQTLDANQCQLGYRDSIFKHSLRHSHIILAIRLRLSLRFKPDLSYGALQFQGVNPSASELLDRVIHLRQSKLPDPAVTPNAGSFFKNPVVTTATLTRLLERYVSVPHYPAAAGFAKLAAAWLIEQAGCKGQTYSGVNVHALQALVLTNPAHRPRTDVLACAATVAQSVQAKFGIVLEIEPQLLG
ncbi:MAG TPA: UDP-N-acetylmuramate dehydrogenase [Cellvibrionaceae bacterium]